jgi:SSS family solute:Na+ symporter
MPTTFFLAEGALTWWAIGASLIASNISAEQFIGMSGSGFAMGLAIASYEWMAALTLIVVAVFFMPATSRTGYSPCRNSWRSGTARWWPP